MKKIGNTSFLLFPFPFYLILVFCLISFVYIGGCSDNPSETKGVTYSGNVLLEGESDFSEVVINLYRPAEIDPDLIEINLNYPKIGVEFTQKTEFYHRDNTPVFSTITQANGDWKIENVTEGKYHIVAEKEGYGWQVIYNSSSSGNNFSMKKTLKLTGNYIENMNIPGGTFVEIVGDVFIQNNATLTVGPGVVVEFEDNNILSVEGNFICQGSSDQNIIFLGYSATTSNKITIKNSQICALSFVVMNQIKNGIFLSAVDSINIDNMVQKNCNVGFELFNCGNINMSNSNIIQTTTGIIINSEAGNFNRNIVSNANRHGIEIINTAIIDLKFNLIQMCGAYGIAVNDIQFPTQQTSPNIIKNDINSNLINIYLGPMAGSKCNYNNILQETSNLVAVTSNAANDTLDFQNNYWGYFSENEIGDRINDHRDMNQGVTIDYSNYLFETYNWQSELD